MGAALIAGAAALAVLAGVLIWRAVPKEEAPAESAAPVMAPEITIPDGLGLRLEDLQYIRNVVIVGDEAASSSLCTAGPPAEPGAQRPRLCRRQRLERLVPAGESGHGYAMTPYDDLRFPALMPRLRASFALVDIRRCPI